MKISYPHSLRELFNRAVAAGTETDPAKRTDMRSALPAPVADKIADEALRRPPVHLRTSISQDSETMSRYINGLEIRQMRHLWRNAPLWHARETAKVLGQWSAPVARHPAPSWATPRDILTEAREYAAIRVRDRLVDRMIKIHDLRTVRNIDQLPHVPLLRQAFEAAANNTYSNIRLSGPKN